VTDNAHKSTVAKDATPELSEAELAQRRRSFMKFVGFMVFVLGATTIYLLISIVLSGRGGIGDGRHVETYGFDVSNLNVDRATLVASGLRKDGRLTLTDPPIADKSEIDEKDEKPFSRLVISKERIIGVEIGGEARAYPIRFIQWHEVINDTLGGVPIAVTYSPLTDSAVVFDRRVGEETLEFGFSGLLSNSNLVMYDRRDDEAQESLWSQLRFRAIAGPLAGQELTVLPARFETWGAWRERHGDSGLLKGVPQLKNEYKRYPFREYYQKQEINYPVAPDVPEDSAIEPWVTIMAWREGESWRHAPLGEERAAEAPGDAPRVTALWWAWYAMHGEAESDESPDAQTQETEPPVE